MRNGDGRGVQKTLLGQQTFENDVTQEIDRRIANSWKCFWSLREVLCSNMNPQAKKKLFESCILPSFTYGCQTWPLKQRKTQTDQRKLKKKERKMLHVRLKDKLRNTEIRRKTKLKSCVVPTHQAIKMEMGWTRLLRERWEMVNSLNGMASQRI